MRKAYSRQRRFDCSSVAEVRLNFDCRDEIVPILAALQCVYTDHDLRRKITKLVADDLNGHTRRDVGRTGFDDWQVVVLAAVRLGCNLDYDKLQDLAENHRALRGILDVGDWDAQTSFLWKRLRNTICLLRPETLEQINHAIVEYGQRLHGEARHTVRADSFVTETDIHYPTESSLIWDGVRKIIPLCVALTAELGVGGWRQHQHLQKRIKQAVRLISQISASKSPRVKARLPAAYEELLERTRQILKRANSLVIRGENELFSLKAMGLAKQLGHWISLVEQVCDTAQRRVLLKEQVPNADKLFSLFETHTQLYRRGKAGETNQFGRLVLVFEDAAGFISHYYLMDRNAQDADVIVEQTRQAQKLHGGEIERASFDRGFHTLENAEELAKILRHPCLPPRHPQQFAEQTANASVEFHRSRRRHPGIESAIGALQAGNGLKRCRDHSELGLARYLGLAVLGRNLHVLGKLLIARRDADAAAAFTKRKAA
jgi:transposase, IS5 family